MSCLQVTAFRPSLKISNQYKTVRGPAIQHIAPANIFDIHNYSPKLTIDSSKKCMKILNYVRQSTAASKYQQCAPVCLFGGKGKSDNGNESSPWKSLEKAMGSLKKEQSLEDVLRKQMEKQDYYDDKGGGGTPPGGGGGGGSGGSGGIGEPEDEGLSGILDEIVQVTMATLGIIFLYTYILAGDEITTFIKDVLKFIMGGGKSLRIKRILYEWGAFYERLKSKDEYDPYWLEKEILCTPTWYDSPTKYINMFESSMDDDDDDDSEEDENTETYNEITNNNDDNGKENTYSDNAYDDNNEGDMDNSYNDDDDDF